jgi:hypothetical protein
VQFADKQMLIPIMEAWVFAGRKLDPNDDESHLYFQDAESYRDGIRYHSATDKNSCFQVATDQDVNHIFEYERALDMLLLCSLRRKKELI